MTISVRQLLEDLGFNEDSDADSLSYDFGNLELSAFYGVNRWLTQVWCFAGAASDGRSLALIEFEMPTEVDSREQGVAWISEHVHGRARFTNAPAWLQAGLQWRGELPWIKERLAFQARERCTVERDWFRLPGKTLRQWAEAASDEDLASFSFDGKALSITNTDRLVVMPAAGTVWKMPVSIRLPGLRHLPKRLIDDPIEVAVWQSHLHIARMRLPIISDCHPHDMPRHSYDPTAVL